MSTKSSLTQTYQNINNLNPQRPSGIDENYVQQAIKGARNMAENFSRQSEGNNLTEQQQNHRIFADMDKMITERDKEEKEKQDRMKFAQPQQENIAPKEPDGEPHGFDTSDKMCMLGALTVGGFMGATDTAARVWQLIGKGEELGARATGAKHWADNMAGGEKDFTGWYNREKSRSKLYQEAIHSHPIAYEFGNLAGSLALANPFLKGMGALFSGVKLEADAEEAVNTVSNIAKNTAGEQGFTQAIGGAIKRAAAKGIINANKSVSPMTMAKWVGQGAVLGEMQYDPENNHYIGNAIAGGLMGLTFGAGGKLFQAFASPLANEILQTANQSGISLPIKPTLEKFSKWLPFNGYGKLMMDRAKQITGKAKEIMAGEQAGKDAIARDLDGRIQDTSMSLSDSKLSDYEKNSLSKELANLQQQRTDIGSKSGYNQYMFGKAKEALNTHEKTVSDLNEKIHEKMNDTPAIEMNNTQEEAIKASSEEQEIPAALRKSALLKITDSILQGSDEKLQKAFDEAGLRGNTEIASAVEDLINGKLAVKNKTAYKILQPYTNQIVNELHSKGLPAEGIDKTELIHALTDVGNLPYPAFRRMRTRVGEKINSTTNSTERRYYKQLYRGMSVDLEEHIKKYGDKETMDMYKMQNKIYADKVVPLKTIVDDYSSVKDSMADKFIGGFLKPDQPNGVNHLLSLMPQGDAVSKLAMKSAILHEAWDRVYIDGVGVNPLKWIHELTKLGETNNVIFSSEEMNVLKGYKDLINKVERISPEALAAGAEKGFTKEEPLARLHKQQGIKHTSYLVGGAIGMHFSAGAVLPLLLTGWGVGRLLTSNAGRKLMIKMAKVGSGNTDPIVKDIFKYLGFYPSAAGAAQLNMAGEQ